MLIFAFRLYHVSAPIKQRTIIYYYNGIRKKVNIIESELLFLNQRL
ncbi:hypothetical protein BBU64B_Y0017 (plasmid) [Borreliella burgdorferi 64b]|nr:hypothetical protein BBU64B_Y0017 [Borreliella burgdorferi 64b]